MSVSKKDCHIGSNESDNYSDKIGENSNVFPVVKRDEETIGRELGKMQEVKCDDSEIFIQKLKLFLLFG